MRDVQPWIESMYSLMAGLSGRVKAKLTAAILIKQDRAAKARIWESMK